MHAMCVCVLPRQERQLRTKQIIGQKYCEFTVNKKFTDGERIYTNIEKLKETPIHLQKTISV